MMKQPKKFGKLPSSMWTIKLATLCLIVLFSKNLLAQADNYQFKAGVMAGISTTQISGDELAGFNQFGLLAGGFTNRQFSEQFSMELELSFIQKGSRKNPDPEEGDYQQYILRLNYLEVPLLFKYHLNDFRFYICPSAGFLVGNVKEEDANGSMPGQPPFKPLDISAGLGMSYPLMGGLEFDLRFTNSLLPIRNHAGQATYRLNKGQYNTVLAFLLRYQF